MKCSKFIFISFLGIALSLSTINAATIELLDSQQESFPDLIFKVFESSRLCIDLTVKCISSYIQSVYFLFFNTGDVKEKANDIKSDSKKPESFLLKVKAKLVTINETFKATQSFHSMIKQYSTFLLSLFNILSYVKKNTAESIMKISRDVTISAIDSFLSILSYILPKRLILVLRKGLYGSYDLLEDLCYGRMHWAVYFGLALALAVLIYFNFFRNEPTAEA